MVGVIRVIPDRVISGLKDLTEGLAGLPDPGEVQPGGVGVGVTGPFRAELSETAGALQQTTIRIVGNLRSAESAIRTTVAELVANDASIAADAEAFLGFLDAAVQSDIVPSGTSGAGTGHSRSIVDPGAPKTTIR